jgi:hypothetical protein
MSGLGADLARSPSPISLRNVEWMLDWCHWPRWDTFSNVLVVNDSHVHIPQTTISGPWFFFLKSTCKWADHNLHMMASKKADMG